MANNIIKRVWNQGSMTPIEDLQGSAFTNENGGHTFQISGVDSNGESLALSGTIAASFLRPDQTTVGISGSVSGGVASVTLSEECYGIPGRFGLVVFLTSDGKKTAIYSCVGNVARSSTDAVAPGVTADVVDLINEIETAVGTIPASYSALMADIAPTYSSSALYAVGDYAWYEGDLKRCIVPITVGETYTPAHWTSAVVGDDVCALKSAINVLEDTQSLTDVVDIPVQTETDQGIVNYSTGEIVTSSTSPYSASKLIDVSAFDNISYRRIEVASSNTSSGVVFYTASGEYIYGIQSVKSASAMGYSESLFSVSVPGNAKYLRVTFITDTQTYGEMQVKGYTVLKTRIEQTERIVADEHNLIDYGYGTERTFLPRARTNTGYGDSVGVTRYRTNVKLFYEGEEATDVKRIKLSGTMSRNSGANSGKDWTPTLQLTAGEKYKLTVTTASGTGTQNNEEYVPSGTVYISGSNSSLGEIIENTGRKCVRVFTAPAEMVSIGVLITDHVNLDRNYSCDVILEKYVEDPNDRIDLLSENIDQKLLAMSDETVKSHWTVSGRQQSDGSMRSSSQRLTTTVKVGIPTGEISVHTLTGYEMCIFVWNTQGNEYLGAYCTDGTVKKTGGTVAWITSFDFFHIAGDLRYHIVLRNAVTTTATMTLAESVNCVFTCVKDTSKELRDKIGVLLDWYPEKQIFPAVADSVNCDCIGVSCENGIFTLNGTNTKTTNDNNIRILAAYKFVRANSASALHGSVYSDLIPLKKGHQYKYKFEYISGTSSNLFYVNLRDSGNSDKATLTPQNPERDVIWASDNGGYIMFWCPNVGQTFTNYKFRITLVDMTESIFGVNEDNSYRVATSFTRESIYETAITGTCQGMCTDGENIYVTEIATGDSGAHLRKIDTSGNLLAENTISSIGHGNQLTYDSINNLVLAVGSRNPYVYRIDPDTLELVDYLTLETINNALIEKNGVGGFWVIAYDADKDVYIIGNTECFAITNNDFSVIHKVVKTNYESGDGQGLYPFGDVVYGNFVSGTYDFVAYNWDGCAIYKYDTNKAFGEFEGVCKIGDTLYSSWQNPGKMYVTRDTVNYYRYVPVSSVVKQFKF